MDTLPDDVIKKACAVLGAPTSVFDRRLNADQLIRDLDRMAADISALKERVFILETEKQGLLSILQEKN